MIETSVEDGPEGRTLVIPWKGLMGRAAPICLAMLTPLILDLAFCAYHEEGFKALFFAFFLCWIALAYLTIVRGNSTRMRLLADGTGLEVVHGPHFTFQPSGRVPCSPSSRIFLRPQRSGLLDLVWAYSGNEARQELCVGENEAEARAVFTGLSRLEGAVLMSRLKPLLLGEPPASRPA